MRAITARLGRFEAELARRERAAVVVDRAGGARAGVAVGDGDQRAGATAVPRPRPGAGAVARGAAVPRPRGRGPAAEPRGARGATYAARFVQAVGGRPAFRVMCWAPRGEGKSFSALIAIMLLADLHREQGYAGPLQVLLLSGSARGDGAEDRADRPGAGVGRVLESPERPAGDRVDGGGARARAARPDRHR